MNSSENFSGKESGEADLIKLQYVNALDIIIGKLTMTQLSPIYLGASASQMANELKKRAKQLNIDLPSGPSLDHRRSIKLYKHGWDSNSTRILRQMGKEGNRLLLVEDYMNTGAKIARIAHYANEAGIDVDFYVAASLKDVDYYSPQGHLFVAAPQNESLVKYLSENNRRSISLG